MTASEIAQTYFDAWNDHDASAVVGTFAEGGTYTDPVTGGPLRGDAIGAYADGLFGAFPDLRFEIVGEGSGNGERHVGEWIMRGRNTGPLMPGMPPTEGEIALPGIDVIVTGDGGIESVTGYFDQKTFVEQLGLQVIVQPHAIGPVTFGNSVRAATGNKNPPGAVSLTWIKAVSDEDVARIRAHSQATIRDLLGQPGMIGVTTGFIGRHGFTVTAWENEDALVAGAAGEGHRAAMKDFFSGGYVASAFTSRWVPGKFNALWVKCDSCGEMADSSAEGRVCGCGASLPEAPGYW